MTDEQIIAAFINNFLKQVNEDLRKKPNTTTLQLYNAMVAQINAIAAVGLFQTLLTQGVEEEIYAQLEANGFSDFRVLIDDRSAEGDWATWPVPYAV